MSGSPAASGRAAEALEERMLWERRNVCRFIAGKLPRDGMETPLKSSPKKEIDDLQNWQTNGIQRWSFTDLQVSVNVGPSGGVMNGGPSMVAEDAGCDRLKRGLGSSAAFGAYCSAKAGFWQATDEVSGERYDKQRAFDSKHKNLTAEHHMLATRQMLKTCVAMLQELMATTAWVGFSCTSVVNLCSAPGGFDTVLANRFPSARIRSFSLSQAEGGMPYLATPSPQITFEEANVLDLVSEVRPMHADLVVMGGSSSGGSGSEDACGIRLCQAQCCVAYRCLSEGGTLFVRLTGLFKNAAAAVFCTLLDDFESVDVQKPSPDSAGKMWHNSFVYVKFNGFQLSSEEALSKSAVFGSLHESLVDQITPERVDKLCAACDESWRQQAGWFENEALLVAARGQAQCSLQHLVPCACGGKRHANKPQCAACWETKCALVPCPCGGKRRVDKRQCAACWGLNNTKRSHEQLLVPCACGGKRNANMPQCAACWQSKRRAQSQDEWVPCACGGMRSSSKLQCATCWKTSKASNQR